MGLFYLKSESCIRLRKRTVAFLLFAYQTRNATQSLDSGFEIVVILLRKNLSAVRTFGKFTQEKEFWGEFKRTFAFSTIDFNFEGHFYHLLSALILSQKGREHKEVPVNTDIHIHLDEISPETAKMLARGCKQLYLNIIAMPNGRAILDAEWEAYQQRKKGENKND